MKVLMIGATGKFAGLVLPELTKRGVTVRALARDENKAAKARERGAAEIAFGDLRQPESLREAVHGVDAVFHIGPAFAPDEAELGVGLVEAAKAADVPKFVFSGVIHPTLAKMTNHRAKGPVEEALYESGLVFVNLQPAAFMQNIAGSWQEILQSGRFALPFSTQAKVCYVDYRDVAEVAALALTGEMLDYGTFELCSHGQLNRVEFAALISEAVGRAILAGEIPFEEWAQKAGLPDGPLREGLRRMNAEYDRYGFAGGNDLVLRAILGREPRTLRDYLRELAQG